MKSFLLKSITIIFFSILIFSCRKRNASPKEANAKCPLMEVNGVKGNVRNFEWVGAKLVRVFSRDSIPTTMVFRYNNKNLAESMEIIPEGTNEKYLVKFQYGDNNLVVKSFVSVNGIQFMTNNFSYSENQNLASINTEVNLFGRKTAGRTRLVYENNNVSKVYSAIDNDLEVLAFSGVEYDDKLQFYPEVYKVAALGFVGIANNFFSYFGKNNMIKGTIYDGNGRIDQETEIDFLYSKNGLPVQSETVSMIRGKRKVEICSYNFGCK